MYTLYLRLNGGLSLTQTTTHTMYHKLKLTDSSEFGRLIVLIVILNDLNTKGHFLNFVARL